MANIKNMVKDPYKNALFVMIADKCRERMNSRMKVQYHHPYSDDVNHKVGWVMEIHLARPEVLKDFTHVDADVTALRLKGAMSADELLRWIEEVVWIAAN